MTKPSLRARFHQLESKSGIISLVIVTAIEAKNIKYPLTRYG